MKILQRKKYTIAMNFIKYSFVFVIALILITPVFAQPCTGKDANGKPIPTGCIPAAIDNTGTDPAVIDNTGNPAPQGVKINTGIANPIAGVEDIPQLIEAILNFVLIVGVPIVALAIIYSGFLFVTAQGNSEKLTTAKKTLLYTLIGAALLLGCLVITNAIKGTVDEIRSTS